VPLGFLIRRSGTEPGKMKKMFLCSEKDGSDETFQPMILSRSLRDPTVML